MVNYIRSDLDFILAQIKVAEAHAAFTQGVSTGDASNPAAPLYGPGGSVPAYTLSVGLRTVDGSYNNLLPGQEQWGAADQPFPELLDPNYRPADGTLFDPDGPGPAPAMPTAPNYNPSNNPNSLVFDSSLRTISNLIVDQTLGNPAAIMKGLQVGGVVAASMANVAAVQAIYNVFKPFAEAEYQARVVADNARAGANALSDGDPNTPPSPTEQAALDLAATRVAEHAVTLQAMEAARIPRDAALEAFGLAMDGDNVSITNVAPDAGLSAPFNSWFTLFGQFFDHGLDLINKGGSGTVFIPLMPDDPLYVEGSHTNFMVLTRATVSAGADGLMGTADDVRPINTTTPFVDQNQTYTSHSSHQVFLRQYAVGADGMPHATGKLIEGGGAQPGGMATWGEVKAQALMLGINLTDQDVGNVPLLRTDQYGNFIPSAAGYAQVIVGIGPDGIPNTADDLVISGTPGSPVSLTAALRIGHAFLADIAHDAVPNGLADGDIEIGLANPGNGSAVYDNELLDAHFIAGDGRVNENIGLTAVHSIFHSEHNRLVEHTKDIVLESNDLAFLNQWLAVDVAAVPTSQAGIDALVWDGERLFQAAKFGTEMQYQHLVFEDFARKIQPNIDFFVVPDGYHADINPSIVAEFAHVVYRFGHSMLTETIDRLDPSFNPDQIDLIKAFLNPIEFDANHTVADNVAAGDIIRGMTRQVGNEIDEFVTSALRNNLLGLPLDLATINLARGRDTGVPSLNAARREFFEVSQNAPELKPYESWVDFAGNLKNEASVINFMAAYGLHSTITAETTIEGKRAAAMAIIFGQPQTIADDPNTVANEARVFAVPADALDFLNSTGAWANTPIGVTTTGVDNIDLWIGGLAEKILPFGGMLGSTFNFVFEVQLEQLQDGDRFYYLQRLDGLHLLSEMENNTFAKVISLNADAGHLPSDVFSTPGLILEVDRTKQWNPGLGESAGLDGILNDDPLTAIDESADNLGNDPTGGSILTPLVIRNNPNTPGPDSNYLRYTGTDHVLLGGTDGDDVIIASEGDDTLYGDAGNDRLEGGAGNDSYIGGAGDDIITDLFGDDIIRAGPGNDTINAGPGVDLVVGDEGQDFIVLGADLLDEAFGGVGNDFVLGSKTTEQTLGGEGNDWIEIGAWTGAVGDNFDDQFARDDVKGHDVFHGDGGFDEFVGEGGDDIWVGSLGRGKFDGMSGFDWTSYADMQFGVDADLNRLAFDANPLPPPNAALDTFSFVEGVSGSKYNDIIIGTDITAADMPTQGFRGSVLDAEGIALIAGLQDVVGQGVTSFDGGNILLGGDGSDIIEGRGGDDIIDGDKWLNVRISVREGIGPNGGIGAEIDSANSMKDLVTQMFNGTYNPGQLEIVREILTANGAGDIDVARFSDLLANYDITMNANGTITVAHTRGTATDGTDTLRNIEVLRFSDQDLTLTPPVLSLDGFNDGRYFDQFNTASYTNSNGITTWTGAWTESGDLTTGNVVTGGQIRIAGNTLQFRDDDNDVGNGGAAIQRSVNLANATNATLSYNFNEAGFDAGEIVTVSFAPDGVNFVTIQTINNASNTGTTNIALTGPFTANAVIRFVASGTNANNPGGDIVSIDNLAITFVSANTPPIEDVATSFTEGAAAVAIASLPLITDIDSTQMVSARVVLTNAELGDELVVVGTLPAGITSSIDNTVSGQLILNLTGAASLAAYQAAIQQVAFDNNTDNPVAGVRTINVTVNDAFFNSNVATSSVTVSAVNDPPIANQDNIITNFTANNGFVVPEWVMLANDQDPEGDVLNVTAATENDGNTFAVTFNNGAVTATATNTANHDFQYTLNDGTSNAQGNVAIVYDTVGGIDGNGNANILIGNGAATAFNGLGGDDIILAGGGIDTITQTGSTGGRDFVDGGADVDTYQLVGAAGAETFVIYTRAAALTAIAGLTLNTDTEIVITRNGSVIAELDNIEEIRVNTQQVTSPGGTPPGGSTSTGGDTIQVIGNFLGTSLRLNTITIDGDAGDDTIDISALSSAHRIVFRSNGGNDTIVGSLRPQDVIELPDGAVPEDYESTTDVNGVTTLSNGTHSISFTAPDGPPQVGGHDDDDDDDDHGQGDDDEEDDEDDDDDHGQGDDDEDDDDHHGGQDDDDDDDDCGCDDDDEVTPPPAPQTGSLRTGTAGNDVLIGTAGANDMIGLSGDDILIGEAGDDHVSAGSGDDFVNAGEGADIVFGGAGEDVIFGGSGGDVLHGEAGDDRIMGEGGDDVIDAGAGNDTVIGGSGNDWIMGTHDDGNDTYFGDDSDGGKGLAGGSGIDTLDLSAITANLTVDLGNGLLGRGNAVSTQSGSDTLWSIENVATGSGNDTITASAAVNVMEGGAGNDTFRFLSKEGADGDTILDFEPGDRLDVSGIDANAALAGNQSFTLVAGADFTGTAQLAVSYETRSDGDYTIVKGNVDATTDEDFRIELKGNHTLVQGNFTL